MGRGREGSGSAAEWWEVGRAAGIEGVGREAKSGEGYGNGGEGRERKGWEGGLEGSRSSVM